MLLREPLCVSAIRSRREISQSEADVKKEYTTFKERGGFRNQGGGIWKEDASRGNLTWVTRLTEESASYSGIK